MQISDQDFGWIIGILEGEGAFAARDRNRNEIAVYSTDEWTCWKLESLIGGSVTGPHQRRAHGEVQEHWKPIWHWSITDWNRIGLLLQCIQSDLSPRRQEQVQKVLDNAPNWHTGNVMKTNTSGISGVSRTNNGCAGRVTHNGERIWLGTFETPELAASAIEHWPGGA